ncbi:hypothetical protein Q3G72_026910 [Acer saccharum]|nr:hypothetical protein Q3G72_026910 [Acer saccharum]
MLPTKTVVSGVIDPLLQATMTSLSSRTPWISSKVLPTTGSFCECELECYLKRNRDGSLSIAVAFVCLLQ